MLYLTHSVRKIVEKGGKIMRHLSKRVIGCLSAAILIFGMAGWSDSGDNSGSSDSAGSDTAPVISVDMNNVVAKTGNLVKLPAATVTDEEADLQANVEVFKGTEKVAVTGNSFTSETAGTFTVRYSAVNSAGASSTVERTVEFMENVLNTPVEMTVPAGEKTEIQLGADEIDAATKGSDGTFDLADYDYVYSDVSNQSAEDVTVGTRFFSGNNIADLTAVQENHYSELSVSADATRTLRFTREYMTQKAGGTYEAVDTVAYFVENTSEADKTYNLTVKNFVLGTSATVDSISFKAFENPDDPAHVGKEPVLNLSNLKSLVDFSGETGKDYIAETKVAGQGSMSTSVTEDGKLRLTVNNENNVTAQWQFSSWDNDRGISKQSLLKRDLSKINYLVVVFERDADFNYENSTFCAYLQSDDWGVSYDLSCPYQLYNNLWYSNIKNQDGENENLVYYYFPIAEHIENEIIASDWCANVDTLILQMAGMPNGKEVSLTIHGIYWC